MCAQSTQSSSQYQPFPITSFNYEFQLSVGSLHFSPQTPSTFQIISSKHKYGHSFPIFILPTLILSLTKAQKVQIPNDNPETEPHIIFDDTILIRKTEDKKFVERLYLEVRRIESLIIV